MNNWFYMNRMTFENLLYDELGENLAQKLILIDFNIAVSFMIGETSDEVLTKIQQTLSRKFCYKTNCDDHCLSCSLTPPNYAKIIWFVQRLFIMSPLTKPFVKQTTIKEQNTTINQQDSSSNDYCRNCGNLTIIILLLILIIFLILIF